MKTFAHIVSGYSSSDRSPTPEALFPDDRCVDTISPRQCRSRRDLLTAGSARSIVALPADPSRAIHHSGEDAGFYFLKTIKYTSCADTKNPTSGAPLMPALIGRKLRP
jgi:hypothetical protein